MGCKENVECGVKRRFQLIQGPPGIDWRDSLLWLQGLDPLSQHFSSCLSIGTGKSVTGAHLAYILVKLNGRAVRGSVKGCVVYCGPSNKAVDVVHGQFSGTIVYEYLNNFILFLAECDVRKSVEGKQYVRETVEAVWTYTWKKGLPRYVLIGHVIELSVKIILSLCNFICRSLWFSQPCYSERHKSLRLKARCQKRFWCDSLHHKVWSTSHKIRDMEAQFQLLHRKNLSPSPGVLKEYKQLIECAEQQVGSMWSGIL